ncbi:rnd superfamily protein [Xanthomonas translucens pv. poae]|uniref:Rnd superfamily protein n=1 Tax=Xanthomonas graminis pv. poae TaxID=227946 RepID=A0A0K2ZSU9_9XANT|nr:rnd superfamily protein [Xanthomonas translucens pv. poae]
MLPVGFSQHVVTFQADVVEREMGKMHHVMGETVLIVMAVVMLFLGWRTGLIVGAIVPLTILGTLIAMRALEFARAPSAAHADAADHYDSRLYRGYRRIIETLLAHKALFLGSMLLLLAGAATVLGSIPYSFLPKSDRLQFQMPLTLQPGSDARQTLRTVQSISRWLADRKRNPEIIDSIGYVADGGPRVVLGLNPPQAAANIAYVTVSVGPGTDLDAVIARVRQHIRQGYPAVRAEPKRFSMGSTESGVALYRVVGADEAQLRRVGAGIAQALRQLPGTIDVSDDWEIRIPRYEVRIDQAKARRAGVSSDDIAQALQLRYSGLGASLIRDDSVNVPIVLRGGADERAAAGDPGRTLLYPQAGGAAVPLSAIAEIALSSEPSAIQRRNLSRAITVTGHNPRMTTDQVVAALADKVAALRLPPGYRIDMGGELEDSAEANQALLQYMPHALGAILLLFIWQFNSFRKLFIVIASIPFVLIGAALALLISGYPFGFMATFGLLALAGIIVNNAVLLLERIHAELADGLGRHEAVIAAALKRLRPIVMTKLTCIVGLVPLMLFAGPLWTGMAITMIGGLALGTLVTLGVIPVLYDLLFALRSGRSAAPVAQAST